LAISLANNGLSLAKDLTFEHLAISIGNGYVEFEDVSDIFFFLGNPCGTSMLTLYRLYRAFHLESQHLLLPMDMFLERSIP